MKVVPLFYGFMFKQKKISMKNDRFHTLTKKEKMTIQLWLGVLMALVGVALLWTGLFIPPIGEIHPSVLTALGEVFTFSGALIGLDYSYKVKTFKYMKEDEDEED